MGRATLSALLVVLLGLSGAAACELFARELGGLQCDEGLQCGAGFRCATSNGGNLCVPDSCSADSECGALACVDGRCGSCGDGFVGPDEECDPSAGGISACTPDCRREVDGGDCAPGNDCELIGRSCTVVDGSFLCGDCLDEGAIDLGPGNECLPAVDCGICEQQNRDCLEGGCGPCPADTRPDASDVCVACGFGAPCSDGILQCCEGHTCGATGFCVPDQCRDLGEACVLSEECCSGQCSGTCTVSVCGDGTVGPGEECEGDVPSDACADVESANAVPTCEDCLIRKETCCAAPAVFEPAGNSCVVRCGNGLREPGEECDDGNTIDGDGCTSTCTVEDGFVCPQTGPCKPIP
jgi:cysteine-rich repeat protein